DAAVAVELAVTVRVIFPARFVDAFTAPLENILDFVPAQPRIARQDESGDAGDAGRGARRAAEAVGVVAGRIAARDGSRVVAGGAGAIGRPDAGRLGGIAVVAGKRAPDRVADVTVRDRQSTRLN